MRKGWSIPIKDNQHPVFDFFPLCFMQVEGLANEVKEESRDVAKSAIQRERNCEAGVPWKQGWSPREHLEMELLRQQIERQEMFQAEQRAREQQFQEERRNGDREFQEAQRERDRQFQAEQKRTDRVIQITLAVVATISGLCGVILGKYLGR